MLTNVAPMLLLVLAAWVGTATLVGARRYAFMPYYLAAAACAIIGVAAVGSILTYEGVPTDRLYEQVLWTGMFLFMTTMLLFRKEELRRGIDNRKMLTFRYALSQTGRDATHNRKHYG